MGLAQERLYTYDDYMAMDDDGRYELIYGVLYDITPAPSWVHQSICGNIAVQINNFLHGKKHKVFTAPFDVRLDPDGDDDTVVQPDITIVCDMSKLDPRGIGGCNGVPDMVLEIISPSSKQMDRLTKFQVYQKFGVREYWLVDPATKTVDVNILTNGKYVKTTYNRTDTVPVRVLEGCEIALADVFEEIREL